eukprot:snap_masked-scaffold_2-processed-gene-4.27-mRNA-1 protein AED:1.00 eAED:1.00 QI:0/0/0/0/1/1/2/0/257
MSIILLLYTLWAVRDAPKTPPSPIPAKRDPTTFKQSFFLCFGDGRYNYIKICITDFFACGPPVLLAATVSRIFPSSLEDITFYGFAGAIFISIPSSIYFSKYLDRTKKYYELTRNGFIGGCFCWIIATFCTFVGNEVTDVILLITAMGAVLAYSLVVISVYELKMEYVFHASYNLEGFVMAVDRVVINLSRLMFVASFPPERYKGPGLSGREFSFVVGSFSMILGVAILLSIKNKRSYQRTEYELAIGEKEKKVEEM